MKLIDKTPHRNDKGAIDFLGKIQGSFQFGLNWGAKLEAQDSIISILEKNLDNSFYLLRNFFIPETDIEIPMVLVGPPGVFLINVVYQRGVYRVNNDEWGTISGDRFIPAKLNQVQRCVKLARVVQIFFERNDIKGVHAVDPILIASDPGMHIESVQPAARIVMVDALERFAISMTQAPVLLNFNQISEITHKLVGGVEIVPPVTPAFISSDFTEMAANEILDDSPIMGEQPFIIPQFNPEQPEQSEIIQSQPPNSFTLPENPSSTKTEVQPVIQPPVQPVDRQVAPDKQPETIPVKAVQIDPFDNLRSTAVDEIPFPEFENDSAPGETPAEEKEPVSAEQTLRDTVNQSNNSLPPKKSQLFGMTTIQIFILLGLLLFWLASMAAFIIYVNFFAL